MVEQELVPKGGAAALPPLWLWASMESGLSLSCAEHVSPLWEPGVWTQKRTDMWSEEYWEDTTVGRPEVLVPVIDCTPGDH